MNRTYISILLLLYFLILDQDHKIYEENVTEETRTLASAMADMLFLDNEIVSILPLLDAGYKASDVIKVLEMYDLTEPEQKRWTVNHIMRQSKFQEILTIVKAGIALDIS